MDAAAAAVASAVVGLRADKDPIEVVGGYFVGRVEFNLGAHWRGWAFSSNTGEGMGRGPLGAGGEL